MVSTHAVLYVSAHRKADIKAASLLALPLSSFYWIISSEGQRRASRADREER